MKKKLIATGLILSLSLSSLSALPVFAVDETTTAMTRLQYAQTAYQMLTQAGALTASAGGSQHFADTNSPAVDALYQIGVIKGVSDTSFAPDGSLTREQAATILNRLADYLKITPAAGEYHYQDDGQISDWAKEAVYSTHALGLMIGTGYDQFTPSANLTIWQGETLLTRLQKLALPEQITALSFKSALDSVADQIRWSGTAGEQASAKEIADAMSSWGYEVTSQAFPFEKAVDPLSAQNSNQATNVIAVKKANKNANGDILIISCHHDSMPSTVGANDNASGTAMLLELARTLRNIETDTEIRFIAFSAEEQGLVGSNYYVSHLSEDEKSHIIGDIQMDMLANYRSTTSTVKTTDGNENLLGNMILKASKEVTGTQWPTDITAASDHMSFTSAGIPGILIEQDIMGVENHHFQDRPYDINPDLALPTAKVLTSVIKNIASTDTVSMAAQAHSMQGIAAVTISENTSFFEGTKKQDVDVAIGSGGTYFKSSSDEGLGWDFDHYMINARWFGWDTVLPTEFVYRNIDGTHTLIHTYIHTAPLGLTDDQLAEKMTAMLGKPEVYDNQRTWGSDSMDANPSSRRYMLQNLDGEQVLMILPVTYNQSGVDLKPMSFTADPETLKADCTPAEYALLQFMHKIIPPTDSYVKTVTAWTDGYSSVLGFCVADDLSKSDAFTIRIDINDFFDKQGNIRRADKLLDTMVHEYAHALTLNRDQIKVELTDEKTSYRNVELYKDGSYLKAFNDQFYANGAREYNSAPTDYVFEYASNSNYEDIAESFRNFVLGDMPYEPTIAAQKVRFFYQYPEMVSIRNYIRTNFGFPN